MSLISRLFSRSRDESFAGAIRIGGAEYNMTWSHARLLSSVYKNPTGYRVIEDTAKQFMRPEWAMLDSTDKIIENDPFLDVLNNPFDRTTGTMMQYHISRDLDINGGTFLIKMRGKDFWGDSGPITGLKRIPAHRVTVMTGDDDELLGFIYVDRAGQRAAILPDEIVYVHFPDGEREWHRMPPAAVAGLPADLDNAAMRFNAELLDNDGGLPGYLVVDGLSPKVFKEWVNEWRSGESPGKTRVLSSQGSGGKGNASYVRVGVSNHEMMYDKLREMAQADTCMALGMPPVLLNPDGTTFANMGIAKQSWIVGQIFPRWVWVRDAMSVWCKEDLADKRKIGFNLETIEELTENMDDQIAREMQVLDAGAQTINQFLENIGRPKVSWGDEEPKKGVMPAALAAANDPSAPPVDEPPVEDPEADPKKKERIVVNTKAVARKDYLETFRDKVEAREEVAAGAMKAMFLMQGEAIAARIRSKRGKSYRKAVEDWWDGERWEPAMSQVVNAQQAGTAKDLGDFVMTTFEPGTDFDMTTEHMQAYLEDRSMEVAGLMNDTTKDEVRAVISDLAATDASVDEMADAVKGYFADNADMRAMRFARTEMIGAANYGAEQAAVQTGLALEKGIDCASDADSDCTDLATESVPLGAKFSNGLEAPPIHLNCRCALVFEEVES